MAWVTWRQHRAQFLIGLGVLGRARARRGRHPHPDLGGLPPQRAPGLPPPLGAPGLRPDHPALPGRVRRLGDGRARAGRSARARRAVRRRTPARPRVRAGHLPDRLDPGDHAPPLAPLQDGAARGGDRRRRGARERDRDVVAPAVRRAAGTDGARAGSTSRGSSCRPMPCSRSPSACSRGCCCGARWPR